MENEQKSPDSLRADAEATLAHVSAPVSSDALPTESLMHELQVHQIELEMQNGALRDAQIALEESRDRYFDLYEFAPVGYLTLSREGMISEINLSGARLLGLDRKKLLNRRFSRLVAFEDNDLWHRHFIRAKQHAEQQTCELVLKRGDGSIFHAQLNCGQIKSGNVLSIHVAIADISARKGAEAALRLSKEQEARRESEKQFQTMVNAMPQLGWIARPDGYITWYNERWYEYTGTTPEQMEGWGWQIVHNPVELPEVLDRWKTLNRDR